LTAAGVTTPGTPITDPLLAHDPRLKRDCRSRQSTCIEEKESADAGVEAVDPA
jgi:hypothetical protein